MGTKTIGILGGMGPAATHYFLGKLTFLTKAEKDQDHIPVLLLSNPLLPDRAAAIFSQNVKTLVSQLQENVKLLERSGSDCIVMPCNTAHYFSADISKVLNVPFINMITITAQFIAKNFSECKKVGILGTTATIKYKIYDEILAQYGIQTMVPNDQDQEQVMTIIEAVKAGETALQLKTRLNMIIDQLVNNGADRVILACTELPLVVNSWKINVIDPMDLLAVHCIQFAGKDYRKELFNLRKS